MHNSCKTVADLPLTQKGHTDGGKPLKPNAINKQDGTQSGQFERLLGEVVESGFFRRAVRHVKIRLESWVQALVKPEFNSSWHSNKLNYLKLLNLMCQCEQILAPFTSFPPTFLPLLQKHQINRIIDQLEKCVKKTHHSIKPSSKRTHPHHPHPLPKVIPHQATKEVPSQRTTIAKTLTIDTSITMHKTVQKPPISNHSRSFSKRELVGQREHSVFDSMDLFKQVSVSSQVLQFTMERSKRSQTMDMRAQPSSSAFDGLSLSIRNDCSRKEYWQSLTITGNATPKYLNAMHADRFQEEDAVIITNRSEDKHGCCIQVLWG